MYEPGLERYDVAIRAVLALHRRGRLGGSWNLLRELGVSREHEELLWAIEDSDNWFRDDESMSYLLRVCPWLLGAAERVLAMYQMASAESRSEFYRRTKGRRAA